MLFGAQGKKLISETKAVDDSLKVVQRASRNSAATALNHLAVRLAAGSGRLAELVRSDQDFTAHTDAFDKWMVAEIPRNRQSAMPQWKSFRSSLALLKEFRDRDQKILTTDSPTMRRCDPEPLTAKTIQGLLSADEALVAYAAAGDEYYVFAFTRDAFTWNKLG